MRVADRVSHNSAIRIEIRDGITGELKAIRETRNMKVYGTVNLIVSGVMGGGAKSCVYAGLGSGETVASADTTLEGEQLSRTIGRLSHDANSPTWSLSFSWSGPTGSVSIAQIGIFTSYTGGILYLKATFSRLTKNSQDLVNVAWTQSLASA